MYISLPPRITRRVFAAVGVGGYGAGPSRGPPEDLILPDIYIHVHINIYMYMVNSHEYGTNPEN